MTVSFADDQVPAATRVTDYAPSVDFTCEPWIGVFPGLGAVSVAADGEIAVSVDLSDETDPHTIAQRESALYWGWAEPLSWVRRGHRLVDGIVVGPREESVCLVIIGDYSESSRVALRLLNSGWALMADRPSPHDLEGGVLTAHPRPAPMLLGRGRALKEGLAHQSVRADSDAVTVEVERLTEPREVAAVVFCGVRRPNETTVQVLTGHEKFRAAAGLFVGGSLDPLRDAATDDPEIRAAALAQHLAVAKHPFLRLRRTPGAEDTSLTDLLEWWSQREDSS